MLARNRLIAAGPFHHRREEDIYTRYRKEVDEPPVRDDWAKLDLRDRVLKKGVSYGGYHRLKVSALTDDLAAALMKAAGFGPGTDYLLAFRYLVRAWAEREYVRFRPEGATPEVQTENLFLVEFDLNYRLRRLTFVRDKLDRLGPLTPEAVAVLRNLQPVYRGWGDKAAGADADRSGWKRVSGEVAQGRWPWQDNELTEVFRRELLTLREQLAAPLDRLYQLEWKLLGGTRGVGVTEEGDPELVSRVRALGLTECELKTLLEPGSDDTCLSLARDFLVPRQEAFSGITGRLRKLVSDVTHEASDDCCRAPEAPTPDLPARLARLCVRAYYNVYEDFDLVLFPLLYSAQVGEIARSMSSASARWTPSGSRPRRSSRAPS